MESVTTLLGEWNSFGSVCSTDEADFMAQLLGDFSLPNDLTNAPSFLAPPLFWPPREAAMHWSENTNPSPESSYLDGGDNSLRFLASKGKTRLPNTCPRAHEKSVSSSSLLSDTTLKEGEEGYPCAENSLSPSSRKRSNMVDVDKSTEMTKPRKSQKIYGSDDDSNWSKDIVVSPRPNGKTRAGRGSATDPQSVYARKRRERINERLRILQSLVPNGTKVDISTMLEEAVQYVKFLQVQIKLLSSDELWMYAPIAYNGMELELDLKTPSPR